MFAWLRELTATERRAMGACFGGWALDALDLQVYSFVIPTLLTAWGITKGQAGLLGTVALLLSAVGGWMAGALADRYGRVRVLQVTILWFAIFTFLSGFTQNFGQLFVCRAMQGLGFGGEWAAGAVLMGEVIRDRYRGRAVGVVQSGYAIGWGAAALLFTLAFAVLPTDYAWRALFWVGLAPAVLVVWVRRHVPEPQVFAAGAAGRAPVRPLAALRPPYLATVWRLVLMVSGAQSGAYCMLIWLPTYLKTARGLTSVGTGSYLMLHILGAFIGFLLGATLADAIGRKRTFALSALGSIVLIPIYLFAPIGDLGLLLMGFPLGVVVFSMFSPMGSFMTELFPTAVRGCCQGFAYNASRAVGSLIPALVGYLADGMGLGAAIAVFALGSYGVMLAGLLLLPETAGRALDSELPEPPLLHAGPHVAPHVG